MYQRGHQNRQRFTSAGRGLYSALTDARPSNSKNAGHTLLACSNRVAVRAKFSPSQEIAFLFIVKFRMP